MPYCRCFWIFLLGGVLGAALLPGCYSGTMMCPPKNRPLQNASMLTPHKNYHADTVTLDVFYVRCPYGDATLNQELWKDVDEQVLSPQLRANLASNGFRMGVIGNQIPASLLHLMDVHGDETPTGAVTTIRLEDMANTPKVMRKTIQVRNGQRNEILVSDILPSATVLFNENGVSGGETFEGAQAVLVVRTQTQGDGSVDIHILPELQYGQVRQQYAREAGSSIVMTSGRAKRTFDQLRSQFNVMPGQIIVMANKEKLPGNVGDFFLTDHESDMQYQKLMCLRVSYSQHNAMFSEDGSLPMDPVQIPGETEAVNSPLEPMEPAEAPEVPEAPEAPETTGDAEPAKPGE